MVTKAAGLPLPEARRIRRVAPSGMWASNPVWLKPLTLDRMATARGAIGCSGGPSSQIQLIVKGCKRPSMIWPKSEVLSLWVDPPPSPWVRRPGPWHHFIGRSSLVGASISRPPPRHKSPFPEGRQSGWKTKLGIFYDGLVPPFLSELVTSGFLIELVQRRTCMDSEVANVPTPHLPTAPEETETPSYTAFPKGQVPAALQHLNPKPWTKHQPSSPPKAPEGSTRHSQKPMTKH